MVALVVKVSTRMAPSAVSMVVACSVPLPAEHAVSVRTAAGINVRAASFNRFVFIAVLSFSIPERGLTLCGEPSLRVDYAAYRYTCASPSTTTGRRRDKIHVRQDRKPGRASL